MYVRLHTDLRLVRSALYDRMLGVRYVVSDDALHILRLLHKMPQTADAVPLLMRKYGLSYEEAHTGLYALLSQLDMYGGIHAGRVGIIGWLYRVRSVGFWRARYKGSVFGFLRSMVHAYGAIVAIGSLLFVWLIAATPALSWRWVWSPGLVLLSCAIHELGHAYAAKAVHIPFIFLAKPGVAAILYARPSLCQGVWIALCGPLLASSTCVLAAIIINSTPGTQLALATGLIHMYSLLPWTADGKTIWRKS